MSVQASRRQMKIGFLLISIFVGIVCSPTAFSQTNRYDTFLNVLGAFPQRPPIKIDTLESVQLEIGWRYKIEYLSEPADKLFDEPEDRIRAYIFIPKHKPSQRLPAIVAIHQDANNTHLGKLEPAGLDIDDGKHYYYDDQKYGFELFLRGYIVICPDRFGHAERRRIPQGDTSEVNQERDGEFYNHRVGQLLLKGRTSPGKEVYDLMRAVDVIYSFDIVDTNRIGAIGHSAGGYNLVYFMFADPRVKVGISSCGFFELLNFFNDRQPVKRGATSALPGLANVGKSADYLVALAPKPMLLTRGSGEWLGNPDGVRRSAEHVQETVELERYARERYRFLHSEDNLNVIYFNGGHYFPLSVKKKAYHWLDKYLNPMQWQQEELLVQQLEELCTQPKQQGKESALQYFLPLEKQDHIQYLIFKGEFNKATTLVKESRSLIENFNGKKNYTENVEFIFSAPDAKMVFLAGSFNGWNPSVDKLTKQKNGSWTINKSLSIGIHCYKFVVDGKWFTDPQNVQKYYNNEGDENSVIAVSTKGR